MFFVDYSYNCLDRTAAGIYPACVDACPVRALDAGPMEDQKVKYGDTKDGIGFGNGSALRPSILIKPRKTEKVGKNKDFIQRIQVRSKP